MNEQTKIDSWLASDAYKAKLGPLFSAIVRQAELAENEAETSAIFERELYYFLRQEVGIIPEIKKEEEVRGLVHSFNGFAGRTSGLGRIDAVINNLVIEYKHHTKLVRADDVSQAIRQVEGYLAKKWTMEGRHYDAILTDGIHVAYFSFVEGEICHTQLRRMTAEDADKIIHAILHHRSKKFNARNVAADFSVSMHSASMARDLATTFYKALTDGMTDRSQMLFLEWKSLIHLSIDDNGKSRDIEKRRRDLTEIFDSSIIDAESLGEMGGERVRFALRPRKVHLFDPETGERLPFEVR